MLYNYYLQHDNPNGLQIHKYDERQGRKKIKQKIDIYNTKTGKKTTKTVKSKIFMYICFDGNNEYIGSLPGNQYVAELTTSNQHRAGNIVCHKWLFGYKQSKEFIKLNSAKVRQSLRDL